MSDQERISGWAVPPEGIQYHFFAELDQGALLLAVCSFYFTEIFYLDKSAELDHVRDRHADGNCYGCRAWLSLPRNRHQLVVEVERC